MSEKNRLGTRCAWGSCSMLAPARWERGAHHSPYCVRHTHSVLGRDLNIERLNHALGPACPRCGASPLDEEAPVPLPSGERALVAMIAHDFAMDEVKALSLAVKELIRGAVKSRDLGLIDAIRRDLARWADDVDVEIHPVEAPDAALRRGECGPG